MILGLTSRRAVAAVGCVAALAVAGCGGSSSSSSSASSSSTNAAPTTANTGSAQTSTTGTATLGVSDNSTAAYLKQLVAVVGPWQQSAISFEGKFQQAVAARNKTLVTGTLDSFTNANETFATKLSNLQPPSSAKSQQDDLVSKVRQLGNDLKTAKSAFEQTNAQALQTVDAKIKSDTQALVQSAAALGHAVRGG